MAEGVPALPVSSHVFRHASDDVLGDDDSPPKRVQRRMDSFTRPIITGSPCAHLVGHVSDVSLGSWHVSNVPLGFLARWKRAPR